MNFLLAFLARHWLPVGLSLLCGLLLLAAAAERTMRLQTQRDAANLRAEVAQAREKFQASQRAEELRRAEESRKVQDAAQTKLDAVPARIVVADGASQRLQRALDIAANTLRQCGRDTAAAAPSPAASAPDPGVFADVRRRIDEAAGIYAAEADRRGIRGSACVQQYDALTPR